MKLFENYKAVLLKAPIAVTADGQSTGVDLGPEYNDDVMVIISIGAVTGTSPTCQIDIETSDAVGGTYTAVASSGSYDADDANTIKSFGINMEGSNSNGESNRFLRINYDLGGTTPSFVLGAVALVQSLVGKSDLNNADVA